MYSTLLTSALFATLALQAVAQFTVQTPTFKQCQLATIKWSGDEGQTLVSVVKHDDPCGNALVDLPKQNDNALQWKVALPAGTKVQVAVEDDSDDVAWSGVITVEDSDDDSCLTGSGYGNRSGSSSSAAGGSTLIIGGTQAAAPTPAAPAATAGASGATANGGLGAANVGGLGTSSGALSQMRAPAIWLTTLTAVSIAALSL